MVRCTEGAAETRSGFRVCFRRNAQSNTALTFNLCLNVLSTVIFFKNSKAFFLLLFTPSPVSLLLLENPLGKSLQFPEPVSTRSAIPGLSDSKACKEPHLTQRMTKAASALAFTAITHPLPPPRLHRAACARVSTLAVNHLRTRHGACALRDPAPTDLTPF